MSTKNMYVSRLIWEPLYESLKNYLNDRRELLIANDHYRGVTGSNSEDINQRISEIETHIALGVQDFINRNESDDNP